MLDRPRSGALRHAPPDQPAPVLRERRDDVARQSVLGTVAVAGAVRRQHLPANALDEPLDHAGDDDIARERRATPRPTTPAPMTATSASSVVRKPVLQ